MEIRLSRERWRHALKRKGKRRDPHPSNPRGVEGVQFHFSKILGKYRPFIPYKKRQYRGERVFNVPSEFSLTDNPAEALALYRDIAEYVRTAKTPRILLDHRPVKSMGLAADSVLAVLLKEASLEGRMRSGTRIRGYKPRARSIRKMMDEIGSVRVMLEGVSDDIKLELKTGAKVFRHQNRKDIRDNPVALGTIGQVSKDFVDHLNACLRGAGRRLTDVGVQRLLSYVGEILANAQEHSVLAEWTIVGYLDLDNKNLIYRCSIISFGETFFETFDKLDQSSIAYRQIQPYVEEHRRRGAFSPSWRREDLIAVIALQGYMSSKQTEASGDRGQGTVDFISFFQDVCKECSGSNAEPRMSVLTGRTLIKFDGTYEMKPADGDGRMIIAFNENNDLSCPPDPRAVVALDDTFPGVVISISIPLTPAVLEEVHGKDDADQL